MDTLDYTDIPDTNQIPEFARKIHSGVALDDLVIAVQLNPGQYAASCSDARCLDSPTPGIVYLDLDDLAEFNEPIHAGFLACPHARVVMWATSPPSVLVAEKHDTIPPVLDDMAQIVGVDAHVVDLTDTSKLKRTLSGGGACLVKQDECGAGTLAVGFTLMQTAAALLVLEKMAKVYWEAQYVGGAKPLNRVEARLMHAIFQKKYSKMEQNATHQSATDLKRTIDDEELALREAIVAVGKQMLAENLVQGTWGNISVQLDDRFMLVTPSGLEYDLLTPYDIVRVDMGSGAYEGGLVPTSEHAIHAALLKGHDDIRSVIHTHPVASSVFAAAYAPLEVTDEADRALLGGDVAVAAYGLPGSKKLARGVVAAIDENRACVMANHGTLVCGTSLDDALEKCRLVERLAAERIEALRK